MTSIKYKFLILISLVTGLTMLSSGQSAMAFDNLLMNTADELPSASGETPDVDQYQASVQDPEILDEAKQPDAVQLSVLTIDDAVSMALSNNRNIEMARQAIELTRAGGTSAMTEFLPDISAVYSWTHNLEANVIEVPEVGEYELSPMDNFFLGLTVSYPLWSGGRESATDRANEADVEVSRYQLEAAEALIELAVFQTYTQILEVQATLDATLKSVAALDAMLEQAQANYDAGYLPLSDLLSVEVARAQANQGAIQLQGTLALGQSALAVLIGENVGDRWSFVPIDYPALPVAVELETLWGWAIENRPELKELQAQRESILANMDAIRAMDNPSVSLSAEVTRQGGDVLGETTNVAGTINFYWDLYNFGRTDDMLGPLEEQLELLDIQEEELITSIQADIEFSLFQTRLFLRNLAVAEQAVGAAEEAFRVTRRRMEEGLGLMLEVLDAEASVASTEVNYTNILYNYYRALASLAQSTGMTLEDLVVMNIAGNEEQ